MTTNMIMINDIYGQALLKYLEKSDHQEIIVHSNIAETEVYPISWFFRDFDSFPEIEKQALDLCSGKVLDVGAGTGSHTLELQKRNIKVTAIDISQGAINCMNQRGVKHALCQDFYHLRNHKYDTILMLMNGFGIMGKIDKVCDFFTKADALLQPNGKIIVDSSDLLHLYREEDGSILIDLNGPYYGEVEFQFEFQGQKGNPFNWLFIDFPQLQDKADTSGFKADLIYTTESHQYLAILTRK